MYSKGIKWATFIINTVLYAMVVFIFYFSEEVHDLKYYDQLSETLPSIIDAIEIWLIFLCVPATLLFSFIMRSIDWHIDDGDGGFVWIIGIILSVISIWLTNTIMNRPSESQVTLYGVMLVIAYLFCTLATFVHQGMMESSGSSGGSSGGSSSDGYSRWTDSDGHSWSCYGGGCM